MVLAKQHAQIVVMGDSALFQQVLTALNASKELTARNMDLLLVLHAHIQRLLRAMRLSTARTASLTSFTILTATRTTIAVLGVAVAVVMASIAQIAQAILHCKA